MFRKRFLFIGLLVALVLSCGAITTLSMIYRVGYSNGFGQGAALSAPYGEGAPRAPYAYGPGYYDPWSNGPHFGFFFPPIVTLCIGGLVFWLVVGGIFRARMWRRGYGPWGHGHGPWEWGRGRWGRGPWGWDQDPKGGNPGGQPPQAEGSPDKSDEVTL